MLVSCLMVTLPDPRRWQFVTRSIAFYCAQTHPERELVIVQDDGSSEIKAALSDHVARLGRDDIRIVEAPPGLSLGALRTLSRQEARGAVHCQWDDDDMFHPLRIETQLRALVEAGGKIEATAMQEVMQFFPHRRTMCWINFQRAPDNVLAGTLMCRAETELPYPQTGESSRRGEDSAVVASLIARGGLRPVAGMPFLTIYVCHGANTWDEKHHIMLARKLGVGARYLRRSEETIRRNIDLFDFGPDPVTVRGPDGVAFILGGEGSGP